MVIGIAVSALGVVFLLLGTVFSDQINTRNRSLQKVPHFKRRESLTNIWITRVVGVSLIVGGAALAIIR